MSPKVTELTGSKGGIIIRSPGLQADSALHTSGRNEDRKWTGRSGGPGNIRLQGTTWKGEPAVRLHCAQYSMVPCNLD